MPKNKPNAATNTEPVKLTPEARVLAYLAADPNWTPTDRGDVRVVNRMLDDGEMSAVYGTRGVIQRLTLTGESTPPATIASNFLSGKPVAGAAESFVRAVRAGTVTREVIAAFYGVK